MANRPCKPDADLTRLRRTLLPNIPFPACGVPEKFDSAADHDAKNEAGDAEPNKTAQQDVRTDACAARFAASAKLEFNKE